MRVFFPIGAYYPSQIGGPCNTIYWHASALMSHGVEVEVVTTSLGIQKGKVEADKLLETENGKVFYSSKNGLSFEVIGQIIKGIKKADVVHLNSLFNTLSIFSFFYIKLFKRGQKIVWSTRGELNPDALKYGKNKKKILLYFYKKLIKKDLLHSTSEKETKEIKKMFPSVQVVEVPNYIYPSDRLNLPIKNQFLYVGRIHAIKALDKMITGFSKSKKFMDSDYKLVLVGKHEERHTEYYNSLIKLIEDLKLEQKIEWKGHLIGEAKEKEYAQSYALMLMSETENFGNVVVEALNQGTPVIASTGTPWQILEEYKCGFFIPNSPVEIANAVDKMMSIDQNEYINYRKNTKSLVDDFFDVRLQITKWIDIYNNEINHK